jgi:hypothetical protein
MKYLIIDKNNYKNKKYVTNILKEYFQNSSCDYVDIFSNGSFHLEEAIDNKNEDNYVIAYCFDEIIRGGEVIEKIDIVSLLPVNNWLRNIIQHDKLKEELILNKDKPMKRNKI